MAVRQTVRNQAIMARYRAGEPAPRIAADYGISHQRVYQIVRALEDQYPKEHPKERPCAHCGAPFMATSIGPGRRKLYCSEGCRSAAHDLRRGERAQRMRPPASSAPGVEPASVPAYLPAAEVMARVGIARTTLHDWVKRGIFPAPVSFGPRLKRWRAADVDAWLAAPDGWRAPGSRPDSVQ